MRSPFWVHKLLFSLQSPPPRPVGQTLSTTLQPPYIFRLLLALFLLTQKGA